MGRTVMDKKESGMVALLTEIVREVSPEELDYVQEQVEQSAKSEPTRNGEPIAISSEMLVIGAALLPILTAGLTEFVKTVATKWGERVGGSSANKEHARAEAGARELEKILRRRLRSARLDAAETERVLQVLRRIARERPELIEGLRP
jgi:hypothetical protein